MRVGCLQGERSEGVTGRGLKGDKEDALATRKSAAPPALLPKITRLLSPPVEHSTSVAPGAHFHPDCSPRSGSSAIDALELERCIRLLMAPRDVPAPAVEVIAVTVTKMGEGYGRRRLQGGAGYRRRLHPTRGTSAPPNDWTPEGSLAGHSSPPEGAVLPVAARFGSLKANGRLGGEDEMSRPFQAPSLASPRGPVVPGNYIGSNA